MRSEAPCNLRASASTVLRVRLAAALLLLVLATAAASASDVEAVALEHRAPGSIVEAVRTLAGPGVTVIAAGGELLLRGPPEERAAARAVVARLDTPPERLRLTLRRGDPADLRRAGVADGREGVRIYGTRRREDTTSEQTVSGVAGEPVRLVRREERLRTNRQLLLGGRSAGVASERSSVTAESGFYALPGIQGERVTIALAASREAFGSDGQREGASVVTTVTGVLGEWIPVASTGEVRRESDQGTQRRTRRSDDRETRWWLRVERLPGP